MTFWLIQYSEFIQSWPFKCQPHKMVKHTLAIRRLLRLKGLLGTLFSTLNLGIDTAVIVVNFCRDWLKKLMFETWPFPSARWNSVVFSNRFYFLDCFFFFFILLTVFFLIFAVLRNVLFSAFFSFLNSFNFRYSNFYTWMSFIRLIYLSVPNLYFYTIRSLAMFLKVLNKVNFRVLTQT